MKKGSQARKIIKQSGGKRTKTIISETYDEKIKMKEIIEKEAKLIKMKDQRTTQNQGKKSDCYKDIKGDVGENGINTKDIFVSFLRL